MPAYVRVAVNLPLATDLFDYHLPDELVGKVQPGSLVVVPFGVQQVQGVVWRFVDSPAVAETRAVLALLDALPVLTPTQMGLAEWLAHESFSPLAACSGLMLPPGLGQQSDTLYQLLEPPATSQPLSTVQQHLLDLMHKRGSLRGRQIESAMPHQNPRAAARWLVEHGWLSSQPVLPPPTVQPKHVRTAQLAISPDKAAVLLDALGHQGGEADLRRRAIVNFLIHEPDAVEIAWIFAGAGGGSLTDLQSLAEAGIITLGETETWRDPLEKIMYDLADPPRLTRDQQTVWQVLKARLQAAARGEQVKPALLHGITSSGKTEIYLQAVAEALRLGRQALILVPEISLTPQTVRRFASRFPGQVGLIHSRLSPGERYDTWRRARTGQLPVIVGPRSALFSPLPRLGLIIVDEFHDESYYQDDFQPAYHAVETALTLARISGSLIVLGSATPDVALRARADRENWTVCKLPARVLAHRQAVASQMEQIGRESPPLTADGDSASLALPAVQVVDMRQELQAGNRTIFSRALQLALEEVLAADQQAILFLNRRGTSTYVFCRTCGASLRCPRCDVPLTYHAGVEALICHTCGYQRKMPPKCPACGSPQIRQFGLGTERVEAEVQAAFPQARVLRWDSETSRQKGAHEVLLGHFIAHRADILVGTQMIAKGLDLPLVTLVGVILADVGLTLPDYRAGERGFQLLTQVAGRAGRSPLGGRVILQTYIPDHYAIQAASHHDYESFYHQELAFRRKLAYPPFARLVRLELHLTDPAEVEKEAHRMGAQVSDWIEQGGYKSTEMIGPAPCFFNRRGGLYRWQIVLRGPDPAAVLRGHPLGEWHFEVDPPNLL